MQKAVTIVNALEERDNSATQERREECPSRGLGDRGRKVTLHYLTLQKASEMKAIWEIQTLEPLPHTLAL